MEPRDTTLTLYSSPVSDCSARLRLALNLKHLPYNLVPTRMSRGENRTAEYKAMNPAQTVPTLTLKHSDGAATVITQSLAALEFLEEAFPSTPSLYPPLANPAARAHVRTLMEIIATDIHPLTTPRVGRAISALLRDVPPETAEASGKGEWDAQWMAAGLKKYDQAIEGTCGLYSVGDGITMADVVLIPELWTATRAGVNVKEYNNVSRVFENLMKVDEVAREKSRLESDDQGRELEYDSGEWRR